MSRFFDDFERASLGSDWTSRDGSPIIVSSTEFGRNTTGLALAEYNTSTQTDDQYCEAELATQDFSVGGGANFGAGGVRLQAGTTDRYNLVYDAADGAAGQWQLKQDGGAGTAPHIARLPAAYRAAPGAGDILRVEARGNRIYGYDNGDLILMAQDDTYSSGALCALCKGSSAAPQGHLRNWWGGDARPKPKYNTRSVIGAAMTVDGAFVAPYPTEATNDLWDTSVIYFPNSGTPGISGRFHVPVRYASQPAFKIIWTSVATTNDLAFTLIYRVVSGDDTESMDQSGQDETVYNIVEAPSASHERKISFLVPLTPSNFSAESIVEYKLYRDVADESNEGTSMADDALIFDVEFEYVGV